MEDLLKKIGDSLLQFMFSGEDFDKWMAVRIVSAFVGGIVANVVENELKDQGSKTKLPFFWKGLGFAAISCLGGLSLIRPTDIASAFLSGMVGWYALLNFFKKNNAGASSTEFTPSTLSDQDIRALMEQKHGN